MTGKQPVIHAAPADGSRLTQCCRRPVFDIDRGDRITQPGDSSDRVTCRGLTAAQLLDYEARWRGARHTGRKDEAIRADLGITPARYYVLLARACDSAEGAAHNPVLARTLRERRDRALAARFPSSHT